MALTPELEAQILDELIEDVLDENESWFCESPLIGLDVEVTGGNQQPYELTLVFFAPADAPGVPPPERIDVSDSIDKLSEKYPEFDEIDFEATFIGQKVIPTALRRIERFGEDEFLSSAMMRVSLAAPLRPCPGGVLICVNEAVAVSTLGGRVKYSGPHVTPAATAELRLLGSNHALNLNFRTGEDYHQPALKNPANVIGSDLEFEPIHYDADLCPAAIVWNQVDISWTKPLAAQTSAEILVLGAPTGIRFAVRGEQIDLHGGVCLQQTGLEVVSVNFRYRTRNLAGSYSFWKRAIRLDKFVTLAGDCGAAYVAQSDSKIVALHRAYVGGHCVGAPVLIR